jgi:hypothetical protein
MRRREKIQDGENANLQRFSQKSRGENVVFCGEMCGKCGPGDGCFGRQHDGL